MANLLQQAVSVFKKKLSFAPWVYSGQTDGVQSVIRPTVADADNKLQLTELDVHFHEPRCVRLQT